MADKHVYRCHWRGLMKAAPEAEKQLLLQQCAQEAQRLIDEGRLMTAALYHYGEQLFLYYEALGEEIAPEAFMGALTPLMHLWPQKTELRPWARMYHIYWHCVPRGEEDWVRSVPPERRRGRIALLRPETMFRYVYHHQAIVDEGKLLGDRYQSIALHEDVLFSYFEEPRTNVNILRDPTQASEAIQGWLDVNPESHFVPLPGSNGANFLLLPEYFALGRV